MRCLCSGTATTTMSAPCTASAAVIARAPGVTISASNAMSSAGPEAARFTSNPASIAVRAIAEPTRPAPKTAIVVTVILSVGVKRG